jgi:hypothetical protein
MASEKNVREDGVLAFNRDANGFILCEMYSGCITFKLFLFAIVSPSEFLDGKTRFSYSFQPVYLTIFQISFDIQQLLNLTHFLYSFDYKAVLHSLHLQENDFFRKLTAREAIRKGENLSSGVCSSLQEQNEWLCIDEEVGVLATG